LAFDRDATLRKAEKLLRQGRLDAAIAEYRSVVEDQPSDWNTTNTLGDLYVRAGDLDKAVAQYTSIADHLAQEGFHSKAAAVYKKILKIKANDEHALQQLGEISVRQGLLADAKAAFSTLAESNAYRAWGMDIIGMTNLTEAKLAREAEICYATLAMVTDYDCWYPGHDSVTVDMVMEYLSRNVENAQKVVRAAVALMPRERTCKCGSALAHAIQTDRKKIPARAKKKLALLVGKYLKK